ncbi:MAG: hypothetical protein AAGJ87_13600 [Pseudomonadota bacterium]
MAGISQKIMILFVFAGLAACASSQETALLTEEPSYQAGYGDGCATGVEEDKSFSTKRTRDNYLFDNDRAYRAGWRQGYLSCGQRTRRDETDGGLILGQGNEY